MTARPIDRSPTRFGSWVAIVAGGVALVAGGLYSWTGLAVGALGVFLLVAGLVGPHRGAATGGALFLFGGALLAGIRGAPPPATLVAVTATIIAWDAAGRAIDLGAQLGRDAPTRRLEAVHVATTAGVGIATVGVGYGLFSVATGDQPVTALVFLLLAAVLLTWSLAID